MAYTIAVTGKGGVGKTTVAGLLVLRLGARGCRPVLAVDADPNQCLDAVLGVQADSTVGGIREEARRMASQGLAAGTSKQELLELKIAESLVEDEEFDLLAMGRPEGPGCYCYANQVLGQTIRRIGSQYPYLVLDNEAGLENLSRRIVTAVNLLVLVTDPSRQGFETVRRLHGLVKEMEIRYERLVVLVNRLPTSDIPDAMEPLGAYTGADTVLALPHDDTIAAHGMRGESLRTLPEANPLARGVDTLLARVGLGVPVPARGDA
jgi:CO dehydrogenase maturation factor